MPCIKLIIKHALSVEKQLAMSTVSHYSDYFQKHTANGAHQCSEQQHIQCRPVEMGTWATIGPHPLEKKMALWRMQII